MDCFDVIIVGAGISGIGAARRLQDECPGKSFALLEQRAAIGGTWDLFRYPGIRSDSDMYTMGYDSKPWRNPHAISSGESIRTYLTEAADERGIDRHIRYGHRLVAANWSSEEARWTLDVARADGSNATLACRFLFMCSGYYSYDAGYTPPLPGLDEFSGQVVHPQAWPADLDYAGKRVVVIGSGATAVTLVPALAARAAKVTMLQRSPTWVKVLPAQDGLANLLKKLLPEKLAYRVIRWKNVKILRWLYTYTRRNPDKAGAQLLAAVRKALGPDYDVERHFKPSYKPWDQRVCVDTDGALFAAIRSGKAEVVTDTIERITADGIALASGERLEADILVTATGLELSMFGGARLVVDGVPVDVGQTWSYRGLMFSGLPNLAHVFGYINASWTLRSDLVTSWVCRVLNHMDATGATRCVPRLRPQDEGMAEYPITQDFSPGYITRRLNVLPRQAWQDPWHHAQDYVKDRESLRQGALEDGVLRFDDPRREVTAGAA
jgi:cation diffusion facilitator CzcD-associated flavoprotein CzcO